LLDLLDVCEPLTTGGEHDGENSDEEYLRSKKVIKFKYNASGVSSQWAKSPKKQSVGCIFDNMALYFECRINKALLQTVFLVILPTELTQHFI